MDEKEKAISEMELQPDEVRRVRTALVNYVETALKGSEEGGDGVDVSIFPAALDAINRIWESTRRFS